MSESLPISAAFEPLLDAVCDGTLAESQYEELASVLDSSDAARRLLLEHVQLQIDIRFLCQAERACDLGIARIDASRRAEATHPEPSPGLLGNLLAVPTGYFSSGWPAAYLIATILFAIGLTTAALIHVSQPSQQWQLASPSPHPQSPTPGPASIVAHITGMVDCVLNNAECRMMNDELRTQKADIHHSSFIIQHSPLRLGDRLALRSGLLELTYDTGAKVILQGPVTYEVESPAGGYLATGKLTAKLEKKSEVRGQRSETSNPQSLIPNPSSSPQSLTPSPFVITTPTAVVTDLGTEFGVKVDKTGSTTCHVFRGATRVHPVNRDKDAETGDTILRENEAARTERDSNDSQRVVVRRVVVKPDDFVRHLQNTASSSVEVLAWFRMGEDEPNARDGELADKEIYSHRKTRVRLERHGSPTYSADTKAPGSKLSMTFHGGNSGEYFSSPRFPFIPNDYFILEAWVKLHTLQSEKQVIVASGQGFHNGYCLLVNDGRWFGALHGVSFVDSAVACEIDKWTHLALLCERGKAQLWVNGQPRGSVVDAIPNMPDGPFVIGGEVGYPETSFHGQIDEVRLSTFIAPVRPEMLLLHHADIDRNEDRRTETSH